jgi:hypothetical protein
MIPALQVLKQTTKFENRSFFTMIFMTEPAFFF